MIWTCCIKSLRHYGDNETYVERAAVSSCEIVVGTFSVIVKTGCGTNGVLHSTNSDRSCPATQILPQSSAARPGLGDLAHTPATGPSLPSWLWTRV